MVRSLDYDSELTLEEANERLKEVKEVFENVKGNYSGRLSIFKRNMKSEDIKILAECSGVLLPLTHKESVQKEVREAESLEGTVLYVAGRLHQEILHYMMRFKNTGVKILK